MKKKKRKKLDAMGRRERKSHHMAVHTLVVLE